MINLKWLDLKDNQITSLGPIHELPVYIISHVESSSNPIRNRRRSRSPPQRSF